MVGKQMADLRKRIIVSSLMLGLLILLLAFSMYSWASFFVVAVVAGFAAIGVWEYAQLAAAKGLQPGARLMIVFTVLEVFAFFVATKFPLLWSLPIVILVASVVSFFLLHFREASESLVHVAVEFFGICYIAVPLSMVMAILYPPSHQGVLQDGRWWLVYLVFVTKITDVGAYFVGRLWGKHKLAPILSPKKTVEGAIAGFACAWLASLLMYAIGKKYSGGAFDLNFVEASCLGILLGVLGQVGDLAESLLKRDAVVKDSNRLPGLGGVLDLVDSLLLTAPVLYLFLVLH